MGPQDPAQHPGPPAACCSQGPSLLARQPEVVSLINPAVAPLRMLLPFSKRLLLCRLPFSDAADKKDPVLNAMPPDGCLAWVCTSTPSCPLLPPGRCPTLHPCFTTFVFQRDFFEKFLSWQYYKDDALHLLRAAQAWDCPAAASALSPRLLPFGLVPLLSISGSCGHLPQAPFPGPFFPLCFSCACFSLLNTKYFITSLESYWGDFLEEGIAQSCELLLGVHQAQGRLQPPSPCMEELGRGQPQPCRLLLVPLSALGVL